MKISEIRPENRLKDILNFPVCKRLVASAKQDGTACAILCPHYSINIASRYEDGEQLQWDLDELSEYLGQYVSVSDYDDLVVDMTEWLKLIKVK